MVTKQRDQDRLQEIIAMRMAGRTLQEIGDKYGLTRERVRQILRSEFTQNDMTTQKKIAQIKRLPFNRAQLEEINPKDFGTFGAIAKNFGLRGLQFWAMLRNHFPDIYKEWSNIFANRWSRKFDECIICHTTDHRHSSRGWCERCHN